MYTDKKKVTEWPSWTLLFDQKLKEHISHVLQKYVYDSVLHVCDIEMLVCVK